MGIFNRTLLILILWSLGQAGAQTPPHLRTPFIEDWGQVKPETLERQAKAFAGTFFIEGPGDRKEIALTFDDGPSDDTPALLDLLKKENVKVTFFWQGQNVLQYPEIVRRALAEGHVLANHSFSHPNLSKMEDGGMWWDYQMERTQQAFQKVAGFQPAMMRPPYGFLNDKQIKSLRDKGMTAILWSVDSADWFHIWQNSQDEMASSKIEAVIKQYIHPEAIVLMHDSGGRGRKPTIMATKALIPYLRQQGYGFTTVDRLLNIPVRQAISGE
ncbi:polysaccharide deacetylase family protein [Chitinibacter sp. S2-10]|uniref:polysaccharide deacetylase family protein n=1 Tax=Chitinibacter sp. S2-10 TaxID=3373597 RepID=UPI0039776414